MPKCKNVESKIDIWNVSKTDTRTNNTCEGKSETTFILITITVFYPSNVIIIVWTIEFNTFIPKFGDSLSSCRQKKNEFILLLPNGLLVHQKKLTRMTSIQSRINTLHERYNNGLINTSNLLTGLSYLVGMKRK